MNDMFIQAHLSLEEQGELAEHETTIHQDLHAYLRVGQALMAIRDKKLYREGYTTFEDYCRDRWSIARSRAYQLMEAANVVSGLSTIVDILPANEAQARPLTALAPAVQLEAWKQAVDTAPNGKVTAEHVQRTVELYTPNTMPHIAYNSGNNEWYTPPEYIEAARAVMGSIELDPASSDIANRTVQAGTYYTIEDDGLAHEWAGKVWMNPPYAGELIGKFCGKLVRHYQAGDIQQAIVLVNNATETTWFQGMLAVCSAVCFPKSRVRFLTDKGSTGAPLQGQAVLFFSDDVDAIARFVSCFRQFGEICKRTQHEA